jgi:hypothetical protein
VQEVSAHARFYDDAGRHASRVCDACRIALCRTEDICTPKLVFAAQSLAYALPCQRLAPIPADRAHESGPVWLAMPSP